jgi:hypothetical protein
VQQAGIRYERGFASLFRAPFCPSLLFRWIQSKESPYCKMAKFSSNRPVYFLELRNVHLQLVPGEPRTADDNSPSSLPPGCSALRLPVSGRNHRQGDWRSNENRQRKAAGRGGALDQYTPLTACKVDNQRLACWKSEYAAENRSTCDICPAD